MRKFVIISAFAALFASCREQHREINVTETRDLTLYDKTYLNSLDAKVPMGWRRLPGTEFRLLNYVAGKDDSVQIVLGVSQGEVLANANRWLGQFGLTPLISLDYLGKSECLGQLVYLVEADGDYTPGMGQPPGKGYSLIGAIQRSEGNITIKMTGPTEEVEKQRQSFYDFMQGLEISSVKKIASAEPKES